MATESSAIARLVDASGNIPLGGGSMPGAGPGGERRPPPNTPPNTPGESGWWMLAVAALAIGGAIVAGYFLAQIKDEEVFANEPPLESAVGPEGQGQGQATSRQPTTDATSPVRSSAALAAPVAPLAEMDAREKTLDPDPLPSNLDENSQAAAKLASQTGFDILVEPRGAKISLDGQAIGVAPLRVRNLLPGKHSVDVAGPEGYFGQHQEFHLKAGQSMVLHLSLVRLEGKMPIREQPTNQPAYVLSTGDSNPAEAHVQEGKGKSRRRGHGDKSAKSQNPTETSSSKGRERESRARATAVSLGTLMLGSKPPCSIIIDGRNTGLTTPQRAIQLPEGIHHVVLENKGLKIRKSFKVRIVAGRRTRAIQNLTQDIE